MTDGRMTRRHFAVLMGGALGSFAFGDACHLGTVSGGPDAGRLSARPRADVITSASGDAPLGLDRTRDAILSVPTKAVGALPLLVLLHGASGRGEGVLRRIRPAIDEAGVAVLAPDSRGPTWDALRFGFGPDVTFLNRALERVFDTVAIDPARIAVGGFSDGATYALSLGLINGDLFRRIVAFSPGFHVDGDAHGRPRIFISHGRRDTILPIDQCSRLIVPELRRRGLDVTYREFDGGHEVPAEIARDAMVWITAAK